MFKFKRKLKKTAAVLLSTITVLSTMSVGITAASAAKHSCSDITNCYDYVHNVGTGYNSSGGRLTCYYNGYAGGVYFFNASKYKPLSMNDKGVAFCIQNSNDAPWTGLDTVHYSSDIIDINKLIGKTFSDKYGNSSTLTKSKANLVLRSLYYGWNGPGCIYGDNDYQKGYLVTRAVASHFFQNSGASTQNIGMLKNKIVSAHPNENPTKFKLSKSDLKFNVVVRSDGSAYLKTGKTQLISADPTVNLKTNAGKDMVGKKVDPNATISFKVPWRGDPNVPENTLYLVNDTRGGETKSGQTVTLHGGDEFHFTAYVSNTQSVSFSKTDCATSVASVYVLPPLNNYKQYQTLARLFYAPSSQALSFNIEAPHAFLQLQKVSANTAMTDGNDCYSFEDAEFAVFDDKTKASDAISGKTPEERKKGAIGVIVTDKNGKGSLNKRLPIGDYYAVEAKAPKNGSYEINNGFFAFSPTTECYKKCIVYKAGLNGETTIPEEPYNDPMFINITKTDNEGKVISTLETVFEVKYYDGYYTKESEIDKSKLTATWYFKTINGKVKYREDYLDPDRTSSPLYINTTNSPAIPLGTITIREIEAPKGTDSQGNVIEYKLDDTLRIHQIQRNSGTGTTEEEYTFDDEIVNRQKTISTTAVEESTGKKIAYRSDSTTIKDTVYYAGLDEGKTYTAVGWLVNKATGAMIGSKKSSTFFAGANGDGKVSLSYAFNSVSFSGSAVVAYAEIYEGNINPNSTTVSPLLSHKDRNSSEQTVSFLDSGIATQVKDNRTGTNTTYITKTVSLTDTITYKNIASGNYKVVTRLAIKDKNGDTQLLYNDYSGNYNFAVNDFVVNNSKEGSINVSIMMPTSPITHALELLPDGTIDNVDTLEGKSIVLFQYVVNNETDINNNGCIAKHEDINDADQTITFIKPKVYTYLVENNTKDCDSVAQRYTYPTLRTNFTDKVTISGLIAGNQYTVNGNLVKKDGTVFAKGVQTIFTATGKTQTVDVSFPNVNTSGLGDTINNEPKAGEPEGEILAANIEVRLGENGVFIDTHNGVENGKIVDPKETITIVKPKITTNALDVITGSHYSHKGYPQIVDEVTYENVIPGVPVWLETSAVDSSDESKSFGLIAASGSNSKNVSGMVQYRFTPTKTKGMVSIAANLNSFVADSLTIHEVLKFNGNITIAEHKPTKTNQLGDGFTAQSIKVVLPQITTSAVDKSTSEHIGYTNKNTTIVDTVTMTNLIPGKTYTVSGVLMDKTADSKGKTKLLVNGVEVTAKKTFTAGVIGTDETTIRQENGLVTQTVKVEYTFDSTEIDLADIVVFENLYFGALVDSTKLVGAHKDINDSKQTVRLEGRGEIRLSKFDGYNMKPLENVGFTLYDSTKTPIAVALSNGVYYPNSSATTFEMYTDANGVIKIKKLSKGVYFYKETSPNGKYITDGQLHQLMVTPNKITTESVPNTPKKGDIRFAKVDKNTNYLANATFDIFTDEKCTKHAKDFYDNMDYAPVTTDESGMVIFNNIPCGTYYIKETDTASDKILLDKPIVAVVNENETSLTYNGKPLNTVDVESDSGVLHLPVIANNDITISTTAVDASTGSHSGFVKATGKTTIRDTVKYTGLRTDKTYVLVGVLMDKETNGELKINGNSVIQRVEFVPSSPNGNQVVNFTFNNSTLKDKSVVVFETLYCKNDESTPIAEHKDINDSEQTVKFTEAGMSTSAIDKATGTHKGHIASTTTIVDTVTYNGLTTAGTYSLQAQLIDKETGNPITNLTTNTSGASVGGSNKDTIIVPFTPSTTGNGSVDVEINFNSLTFSEKSVVVYETLYRNGSVVALHKDINDASQTVEFLSPKITTRAEDSTFRRNVTYAGSSGVSDYVALEGLVVGQEYTLNSKLVNKEDGSDLVVDGQTIKQSKTFTATAESMEVGIGGSAYKFNTSGLAGKSIVFFEELVWKDTTIAKHNDLNDAAQTITYLKPSLKTEAKDSDTESHYAYTSGITTIIDTVTYDNVITGTGGHQMTISAVNKATGSVITTKTVPFNPTTASGSVEMDISFNSKGLENNSVVIYEELTFVGNTIAEHKDINDADQTVTFLTPSVDTVALDKKTNDHTLDGEHQSAIVDTVKLQGLIVGKEYTIDGKLMKKIKNSAGEVTGAESIFYNGKEVTASKTFVAKAEEESVDVEFSFDSLILGDSEVVVYENLILDNVVIAKHEDFNDADQSVTIHGRGELSIFKINGETNEPLEGAEFKLYYDEALTQCVTDNNGELTVVTDANGCAKFEDLLSGKYYLKEIKAPAHYKMNVETTGIEIKALETTEVTITNSPEKGDIEFIKVDEAKEPVENVTFEIYSDEAKTTPAKDFYGNEYEPVTTNTDGKVEFGGIGYGTYYITETQTQNGKQLMTGVITAVVDASGTKLTVNGEPLEKKTVTDENGNETEVDIVENVDIPNMPKAGGAGVWLGTAFGALLLIGGSLFFFVKRRKLTNAQSENE